MARLSILLIPNSQDASHKVDIRVLEIEDLAQSRAGVQRDRDNPAHVIDAAAGEKPAALFDEKVSEARVVLAQELDAPCRAFVQQFPLDGAVEHVPKAAHHAIDRRGLVGAAFLRLPILQFCCGDLANRMIPEDAPPIEECGLRSFWPTP